jgi:glycosyltransferase involved in cell wall biosynthesis
VSLGSRTAETASPHAGPSSRERAARNGSGKPGGIVMLGPPGGVKRSTWSGIPHYMERALREHLGEVVRVAPPTSLREAAGKARDRLSFRLLGRGRVYSHSLRLARRWGRLLSEQIPRDAGFVIAPAGSTQIAFLETDVPIVYTAATTFRLIHGYYPEFSGLPRGYVDEANEIEQRALERAALVVYPSEWAADSARDAYGVAPEKVRVFPYGANLDLVPDRALLEGAKSTDRCRLAFLGVDWERKGGAIAHEAVATLREDGIDARLTVVGCTPPERFAAPWMKVIPHIDKSDPEGAARLASLLLRANFLILPTRRECFGIVFCEASAHGAPSIATDTGGVAGAVTPGENGLLLPLEASGREYAARIRELLEDPQRYAAMVERTREAYETRLNWTAWAHRLAEHVRPLL